MEKNKKKEAAIKESKRTTQRTEGSRNTRRAKKTVKPGNKGRTTEEKTGGPHNQTKTKI